MYTKRFDLQEELKENYLPYRELLSKVYHMFHALHLSSLQLVIKWSGYISGFNSCEAAVGFASSTLGKHKTKKCFPKSFQWFTTSTSISWFGKHTWLISICCLFVISCHINVINLLEIGSPGMKVQTCEVSKSDIFMREILNAIWR